VQFAMRYLSYDGTKNLTAGEAGDLAAHGVQVGVIWETTADRALAGYAAGAADAQQALQQAAQCGIQPGRPIYAAVDTDVSSDQMGTVLEYFQGWNTHVPANRTGVYGGYQVVTAVTGAGLADYGWQTSAWSGGSWADVAIRQDGGAVIINGVECDRNTGTGDTGCWYPVGSQPPASDVPTWPGRDIQLQTPYMAGDDIRDWQGQMSHRGWRITVDGEYGPKSAGVCKAFQEDSTAHGWPLKDDSIVGPATWRASWARPVS
jgi:hypothetical protein